MKIAEVILHLGDVYVYSFRPRRCQIPRRHLRRQSQVLIRQIRPLYLH
jgi:hypothetical protein